MSEQDAFEGILGSLHAAMLDDVHWPATSALIDEACGTVGNFLMVGEGPADDVRPHLVGFYYRGQRCQGLEREYLEMYHPTDEKVSRFRQLRFDSLVRGADLYTEEELQTSPAFNEHMYRAKAQEGLLVRLEGPEGYSHITWGTGDPIATGGWRFAQLAMVRRLMPHVRQFVVVRQALAAAGARNATLADLLDSARYGAIHLDQRGRIMAANDRARDILRRGEVLTDRGGFLRARLHADRARLDRLLANALPASGSVPVSGSVTLRGSFRAPRFAIHVEPAVVPEIDFGARCVAALVLVEERGRRLCVDPQVLASTLRLTPTECRVAAWLAGGRTVPEIAEAMGCEQAQVNLHLRRICAKQGISGQADLVRLVLSVAEFA